MKTPSRPRIGQVLGPVESEGGRVVAKMGLWLQQYLSLMGRDPSPAVVAVTVGGSPFMWQNTRDYDVDAIVSGGTVSEVAFSRDGVAFYPVGSTVRLNPGDSVRITHTVAPSLHLVPR